MNAADTFLLDFLTTLVVLVTLLLLSVKPPHATKSRKASRSSDDLDNS